MAIKKVRKETKSKVSAPTTSNIGGSQSAEFQIIANNLAREGIEVVRSMRDENWLSGEQWNQGFSDPGGTSNRTLVEFNETQNTWSLNFNFADDSLYISPDGVYSHEETGSTKSSYARFVDLDNICADSSGNERIAFPCLAGEQQVGIKVTSRVAWTERGRQHAVTLEELLYAWK